MSGKAVTVEVRGSVAEVVLTQPERGNPFGGRFCRELRDAAIECSEERRVRAVLLRAEGKYFSVGADLKWLGQDRQAISGHLLSATSDLHMAIARFVHAPAPVVVAVHALATGGSVALTAMADFALASRSARFYAAYNHIGFVSDGAGSYFIPKRVGARKAAEFLMLNQTWDAQTAADCGLVNRVTGDDSLLDEARDLAARIASGPTQTFGEMKRLLLGSGERPLETQMELEAQAIARCARTSDSWNAIQSVLARREPAFEGK